MLLAACDDTTEQLGASIVPDGDKVSIASYTFHAKSRSIAVGDSILANSENVYLGRYTDPQTGTQFTSNFIAQFNCVENYGFPSEGVIGDSAKSIELKLFYNSYFGDSLNTMKCSVYELDNTLEEGKPYYTNVNAGQFYDENKTPLADKTYCAVDYTVPDSIKWGDNYTQSITIQLPQELGKRFIEKYYEVDARGDSIGKINFANSEEFINNVFKGVYVKTTQGDGTVMYITMARLNVSFDYYVKGSTGAMDSIATGIATFSSTKEVLQVNQFDNGNLDALIEDNSCTYLKTPAGIFTEVELPLTEIAEIGDTLNSVKVAFTRYNTADGEGIEYNSPSRLLMVRKSDISSFFLKNSLPDNITSYQTVFSGNKYTFGNISSLVSYCNAERAKGLGSDPNWEQNNPDWNKVVLIPISASTDSNGSIVSVNHIHGLTTARLVGGKDEIEISVVTSQFNNE